MNGNGVALRCSTYKFSEQTRNRIEQIKLDRMKAENTLFGFTTELTNTDVLRFLIDQEIVAIERRAAAAQELAAAQERKERKLINQRQRRALKKGGAS
jgi:hypothetical protein